MPNTSNSDRKVITINTVTIQKNKTLIIAILAAVIFAVSLGAWVKHIHTGPQNVFEAMLSQNLSTRSVTKEVTSEQEGESVSQFTQLSLVGEPTARSIIILKQKGEDGKENVVKTETIGTNKADFSRYVQIDTSQKTESGQQADFSGVINQWGKGDAQEGSSQYLQQGALGLIPFANLSNEAKSKLLSRMYEKKVFETDYSKAKSVNLDGKPAWEYPVQINIAEYVGILQSIAKEIGLAEVSGLDPEAYKDSPPAPVTITVGKYSRQILQLTTGEGQKEKYSAHGLVNPITLPEKTIPLEELQQKLQLVQ